MPTNEELLELLTEEQLKANISEKRSKIAKYAKGADVLRSSDKPLDPFTEGRIRYLESQIQDYKEAISTWQTLLDNLPKES
jgi:hypothetical protein